MTIQDVYNKNKEFTGLSKLKDDFEQNEYSLSSFIWIVNSDGYLLVQKRSLKDDNKPGKWGITGGAVDKGETSAKAAVRELKEELGIDASEDELYLIATERRKNKFFEHYFIEKNININCLKLQEDEVDQVKWITIDEYEKNISNALNFQLFKNFYINIYLVEKNEIKNNNRGKI